MGLFIALAKPTAPMKKEAASAGVLEGRSSFPAAIIARYLLCMSLLGYVSGLLARYDDR